MCEGDAYEQWSLAAALIAGQAGLSARAVHAQVNTFEFVVSNIVSPDQPLATIELWAVFDENQYALAHAGLGVFAEADPGDFSDPWRELMGPNSKNGLVSPDGDSVLGIAATQLHFPEADIFADLSNPILAWRVNWSTTDFSPRTVDLSTATSKFDLYTFDGDYDGNGLPDGTTDSFLDEFVEGIGVIQVVPAPGGFAVLAVGWIMATRRQRPRRGQR